MAEESDTETIGYWNEVKYVVASCVGRIASPNAPFGISDARKLGKRSSTVVFRRRAGRGGGEALAVADSRRLACALSSGTGIHLEGGWRIRSWFGITR